MWQSKSARSKRTCSFSRRVHHKFEPRCLAQRRHAAAVTVDSPEKHRDSIDRSIQGARARNGPRVGRCPAVLLDLDRAATYQPLPHDAVTLKTDLRFVFAQCQLRNRHTCFQVFEPIQDNLDLRGERNIAFRLRRDDTDESFPVRSDIEWPCTGWSPHVYTDCYRNGIAKGKSGVRCHADNSIGKARTRIVEKFFAGG